MADCVAIDSNALTYLLDALDVVYGLHPDLSVVAVERLAMIRCFFYRDCSFWVSPTVKAEYLQIGDQMKREKHDRWSKFLLEDVEPGAPSDAIEQRASQLSAHHRHLDDCRVVAEAECLGIEILLSCDADLIRNLNGKCRVMLQRPSDFLAALSLEPGARPMRRPASANPLSQQTWWRL